MWANPQLQDAAFEAVESRLDQAEKNIAKSLHSDDNRERLAASMFVVRNSGRSRRRGWITSSVAPDLAASVDQPSTIVFRWQSPDGKVDDPPMEEVTRDGRRIQVPRYGGAADPVEGELVAPPVLIEHVEPEIHVEPAVLVEPSPLPKWQGPYGPPPLLAHLYQPWTPPRRELEPPRPEPRRRMSRGGYR
jgi:hypothetical protein